MVLVDMSVDFIVFVMAASPPAEDAQMEFTCAFGAKLTNSHEFVELSNFFGNVLAHKIIIDKCLWLKLVDCLKMKVRSQILDEVLYLMN